MKSALDRLFDSDEDLTPEQQEQILRELAVAVTDVGRVQASPEHDRIMKLIRQKIAQGDSMPPVS